MYLSELTYIQFAMKYTSSNAAVEESDFGSHIVTKDDDDWELTDEMNLIVSHDFQTNSERYTLPKYIKLSPVRPGEAKYMKRRSRQVIRLHKINANKHPHEYYYSQLQLYSPFRNEAELEPNDLEQCKLLFDRTSTYNDKLRIDNVRSILMPHLESVEQGTARAHDTMNSEVQDMVDSTFAQEQADCELEGFTEDSDFSHKDPSDLDPSADKKHGFRQIEL